MSQIRDEKLIKFFNQALNRTLGYHAFRNKLAHNLAIYDKPGNRMVLQEGYNIFHHRGVITDRDLVIAARNFDRLYRLWLDTCPFVFPQPKLTPEVGLHRLEMMPGEANST